MSRDFWRASGFDLLERTPAGCLTVTDDFLRAYLARPEIAPIPESCGEERALHAALMEEPRRTLAPARLDRLADPDARENYAVFLRFRDRLLASPTLEAAFLALFREGTGGIPSLFLDQLAQVILRNLLDGCDDPVRLRAAELLFRTQRVTLADGAIVVADAETVDARARDGAASVPGGVEIDVLDSGNADLYWSRSDRFDTALEIGFARPGLDGLCRVLEGWTRHFLGIRVGINPVQRISDERWSWHIGLDAEASRLLDELWNGREVEEDRLFRVLSLFRLDFEDPGAMLPSLAGRPVYMAMAMTGDGRLRLKPQNLLVNLPLAGSVERERRGGP